jgi:hypothetical protein
VGAKDLNTYLKKTLMEVINTEITLKPYRLNTMKKRQNEEH